MSWQAWDSSTKGKGWSPKVTVCSVVFAATTEAVICMMWWSLLLK